MYMLISIYIGWLNWLFYTNTIYYFIIAPKKLDFYF